MQKFFGPGERVGGKGWDMGDQFLPAEEMGISWVTNLVVASTLLILLTRTKVHTLGFPAQKTTSLATSNKTHGSWEPQWGAGVPWPDLSVCHHFQGKDDLATKKTCFELQLGK